MPSFDHFSLQQPQGPAFSTFWRFTTGDGNQVRFGISIQAVLIFAIRLFALYGSQSLRLKRATNMAYGSIGNVQGSTDLCLTETFIHFEQDPCSGQFPSWSHTG
jgi:hypothetical protein